MRPGQHLDRIAQDAVTSDTTMIMSVGASKLSKASGITRIRFRSRCRVPLPIPRRRHWVNRDHRIPSSDQRPDEQTPISLSSCLLYTSDAADDLTRVDVGGRRNSKK